MPIIEGAGRFTAPTADEATDSTSSRVDQRNTFIEHRRTADLSVGTYSLPAGGVDDQSPHTEDEIYVVTTGRATFVDAAGAVAIAPGDTIFVAAGEEHRFVDITEDLALAVVFAPPYRSRAT